MRGPLTSCFPSRADNNFLFACRNHFDNSFCCPIHGEIHNARPAAKEMTFLTPVESRDKRVTHCSRARIRKKSWACFCGIRMGKLTLPRLFRSREWRISLFSSFLYDWGYKYWRGSWIKRREIVIEIYCVIIEYFRKFKNLKF